MDKFYIYPKKVKGKNRTVFVSNNNIVLMSTYSLQYFLEIAKQSLEGKIDKENNKNNIIKINNEEYFKRITIAMSLASRIKNRNKQLMAISFILNVFDQKSLDYWYSKLIDAYREHKITGTYRILRALKVILGYE